jgi:hypothetical protein
MESQEQERERSNPGTAGRKPALSARCVMRVLADSEMGTVIAYEPEVKSADGARSLVFENDAFYLRVHRYPKDWRKLPDAELLRLMHDAPV